MVPGRRIELEMCRSCVVSCVLNNVYDDVQLLSLLMNHVRNIAIQLVQLANTLLDVADLALTLDNERLLEVDFLL